MRTRISLIVLTLFFTTGIAFCSESVPNESRSAIGIRLDEAPLPELLVKHLGIKAGQGLRIANVMKNSAADEAGLERDDILLTCQGKDVQDALTLTNEVRQMGVGKEVSLEIIHLGQRKTIACKLKPVISGDPDWKYPDEPQIWQSFQPGRVFRIGPGDQDWTQIFDNQIPGDVKSNIKTFLNEMYSSHYNINGKQYTVTIEGNPDNKDSKITVKIDNNEYKTTIGELDKIPQEHREAAKNAIEDAKQKNSLKIKILPGFQDDFGNAFTPGQGPKLKMPNAIDNSMFEQFQEQMKQMQERFNDFEKSQQQILDRLNEKQQPKI
jgi:hypothetical protein